MRHRGVVVVFTAVCLVVILGFAALAIDLGYLQVARAESQNAADAAALAGASAFLTDTAFSRTGIDNARLDGVRDRAILYGSYNRVARKSCRLDANQGNSLGGDIVLGYLDPNNTQGAIDYSYPSEFNAITVKVWRADGHPDGGLQTFFAAILGHNSMSVSASATVIVDNRFSGIRPTSTGGPLTPFAIKQETWEDEIVTGDDNFGYADDTGILQYGDDIPEVRLYIASNVTQSKGKGKDIGPCDDAAGNYGLLDVGGGDLGVAVLQRQIIDGITSDDLISLTGEPMISLFDENGAGRTYQVGGSPGIKAGIEGAIKARLGDVIGFFLYDCLTDQGGNAEYRIVGVAFGRVLDVDLNGNDKRIIIQPGTYTGTEVMTDPVAAPSSIAGRVMLVR